MDQESNVQVKSLFYFGQNWVTEKGGSTAGLFFAQHASVSIPGRGSGSTKNEH